ncbi:hypothetical protein [Saccharothrix obliqua]|uniref:hypothetical protein n=1 Tax=Saccharothrix obliqua TaxID=2861747 RepID=UPI001C5D7859|nr:hypothetical protein [Saccharothrix obliqua]MBW4720833.1 hypothetical protein [Saccharothrix obliqua]
MPHNDALYEIARQRGRDDVAAADRHRLARTGRGWFPGPVRVSWRVTRDEGFSLTIGFRWSPG